MLGSVKVAASSLLFFAMLVGFSLSGCEPEEEGSIGDTGTKLVMKDPEDLELGTMDICMESDDGQLERVSEGSFQVKGEVKPTLLSEGQCQFASQVIQIEDANGTVWTLGVAVEDDRGNDVTPVIDLKVGQTVHASMEITSSFYVHRNVAIRDDNGLAVVWANDGKEDTTLKPNQLDGMSVEESASIMATANDMCGTMLSKALVFSNESKMTVESGVTAVLDMGGYSINVKNISTWDYDTDYQCEDAAGDKLWIAWRE